MIGEDYLSQKKPETEFRSFILNVLLDLTAIGDVVEIQETDESLFVQQKTVYYPGYPSFVTVTTETFCCSDLLTDITHLFLGTYKTKSFTEAP